MAREEDDGEGMEQWKDDERGHEKWHEWEGKGLLGRVGDIWRFRDTERGQGSWDGAGRE